MLRNSVHSENLIVKQERKNINMLYLQKYVRKLLSFFNLLTLIITVYKHKNINISLENKEKLNLKCFIFVFYTFFIFIFWYKVYLHIYKMSSLFLSKRNILNITISFS